MCWKRYSSEEVQEIVNSALIEQKEQFEEEMKEKELHNTIDELKERIEKLEKAVNKVGF